MDILGDPVTNLPCRFVTGGVFQAHYRLVLDDIIAQHATSHFMTLAPPGTYRKMMENLGSIGKIINRSDR